MCVYNVKAKFPFSIVGRYYVPKVEKIYYLKLWRKIPEKCPKESKVLASKK